MGILLPVASGKGGVGKSVVATNLALALAETGKTVVLADLDLGGANLHTLLGIRNRHSGIGGMVHHDGKSIENLVIPTDTNGLFFIPGDTLLPGTANLDYGIKRRILKGLTALPADYVLMDLGAGANYNTVDFFLGATSGIIVTTPEVTAILNAYSFLKTALYRTMFRLFPAKSPERARIMEFGATRIEGSSASFLTLQNELRAHFPETAPRTLDKLESLYPCIILNQGVTDKDVEVGARLRDITMRNLGMSIEYIGFIPHDDSVSRSIAERIPALYLAGDSRFSQTVRSIARRIIEHPHSEPPKLYPDNEDLVGVAKEGLSINQ